MNRYEYRNAIVYITNPKEEHLVNIRNSTERYLQKLLAKGIDIHGRSIDGD